MGLRKLDDAEPCAASSAPSVRSRRAKNARLVSGSLCCLSHHLKLLLSSDMTVLTQPRKTKLQRSVVVILFCVIAFLFWPIRCDNGSCYLFEPSTATAPLERLDRELVVAKRAQEDTTWIDTYLPDWHSNIYVVDDPKAKLRVPTNKGREAMVFLTCVP